MAEPLRRRVAAIAALDEPTRCRLYEHVVRQPQPVSRDEAAAAVGAPRSTAAFHLDRLVEEGLLETVYQRRTGRSGPGAGRPAKLYTRAPQQVTVSLPERHYELAAHLMAAAIDEADHTAQSPRAVLRRHAYQAGHELGRQAHASHHNTDPGLGTGTGTEDLVCAILETHGFEPRAEGPEVTLGNCPFHTLAENHTALVCEMNLHLLTGVLDGLDNTRLHARLTPAPGRCCVSLAPAPRMSPIPHGTPVPR